MPPVRAARCSSVRVGSDEQGEPEDDGQPQHQREHRATPEPQAAGAGDADGRRPGVRASGSRSWPRGDEGGQAATDARPRRAEADARSMPRSARPGRIRSGPAREGDRSAACRPVPGTERTRLARADAGRIRSRVAREGERAAARRPVPRTERTRVAHVDAGRIRSGPAREGDRAAPAAPCRGPTHPRRAGRSDPLRGRPPRRAGSGGPGDAAGRREGSRWTPPGGRRWTRAPVGRRARRAAGRGGARWSAARRPGRAPTRRARWG